MRFASLIHASALVLLLCGCPGAEENGSGSGKPGIEGSGAGSGEGGSGQGGSGQGGAGQGGAVQGGSGQGGSGQGGAGQGGAGQGGSGQGGAGQGGAGQGGAGQGGSGSGDPAVCEEIESEIKVKLVEAQKCKPGIDSVQCGESVSGLCCAVIVNHKDAPEVLEYLEALEKYKGAKCSAVCPAIPCPAEVKGECLPEDPSAGKCVQSP